MQIQIVGDDIFVGTDKVATLNADLKHQTLLGDFKFEIERKMGRRAW